MAGDGDKTANGTDNGSTPPGNEKPPGGPPTQVEDGGPSTSGGQGTADIKTVKDLENQILVNRISVKPAPFNRDDPEIWFVQLETQFALAEIKSEPTKYNYLISALDCATTAYIRPEILAPPAQNRYTALKKCIIDRLCESARQKLNRVLTTIQLGDKKPSQLLREMQALAHGQLSDTVLLNLWLQRLPQHVQQILACVGTEKPNSDLAKTADTIVEVQATNGVFAVAGPSHAPPNSSTRALEAKVDALMRRVEQSLGTTNRNTKSSNTTTSKSGNSSNKRSSSRSRTPAEVEQNPNCWFHHRFGPRARNCRPPCNFRASYRPAGAETDSDFD